MHITTHFIYNHYDNLKQKRKEKSNLNLVIKKTS